MPDAAMTLAALAVLAEGQTNITGLKTLRVKETDRLAALRAELSKTGALVEILRDDANDDESLRITPPAGGIARGPGASPIAFDTYDDHRMAMACSIVGVVRGQCSIHDPRCVAKTYPGYWKALAAALQSEQA
jgi:3-phosphoshikimate 1-carboxyvinyltransferase